MAIDDLLKLTTGFIKGWKKGKLKETLKETAQLAVDRTVENAQLQEKLAAAEDQIRILKGEKKKPKIKPANTSDLNPKKNINSKKKDKKKNLDIDKTISLDIDEKDLPSDAKFVGTREVVIQEMIIKRNNIKFIIQRYYSKIFGKVIEAPVPEQYKGSQFGPQLTSFILYQYYKCRVPQNKIISMVKDWGIDISAGKVCSILNNLKEDFKVDMKSARDAGIKKCSQVHIDDTGAKYKGMNAHTFGVSNKYFTCFSTLFRKNRWAATGAILGGEEAFLIDSNAVTFVAKKLKRPKVTVHLRNLKRKKAFNKFEFEKILDDPLFKDVYKKQRDIIKTACAISVLRTNLLGPKIRFLISDDAGNFKDLIKNHQLCWVHEIRKYKLCGIFKDAESVFLDDIINEWINFYKLMKRFRNNLTQVLREKVRSEFDRITSLRTGINLIDKQLERTKLKKDKLLLFLKYPQVPLHNNLSENDLRERVIKRKISLQNRSLEGMKAWDLMLGLASTCRKIEVSFWKYLEDRISSRETIPYLGRIINTL